MEKKIDPSIWLVRLENRFEDVNGGSFILSYLDDSEAQIGRRDLGVHRGVHLSL